MELFLRRLFEKVGAGADELVGKEASGLTSERLIPALYQAIENSLIEDQHGVRCVVPGQVIIALSYEVFSKVDEETLETVRQELADIVRSYIQDHRYIQKSGPAPDILCDPFLRKAYEVRVGQEASPGSSAGHWLQAKDGRQITIDFGGADTPRRLTLGRTGDNNIVIDDPTVSRFHASLTLNDRGEVIVSDLGSANGTFINGQRIGQSAVVHGDDEVAFGSAAFTLKEG